jgi:selenocysteine-specific elongation factor
MIIATAGHVDHGKTRLVQALTGVDTDRLPEEKSRGLTIDLGFAYLPRDGHRTLGFVDVPGHERFIRSALCGLTGADFVLFVVAADDGPMPQTREHLAVVDLMGLTHGAIALTKTDAVDAARVDEVRDEITALFAETSLEAAPCFPVSAVTGDGMDALRSHLLDTADSTAKRPATGRFRLAVDRSFHVDGAGLVVTGTVFSGAVGVGETLAVLGRDIAVRVRGLHAQNAAAEQGSAGERCALNLTGPDLRNADIARGDWIVAPGVAAPTAKFDAAVRLAAGSEREVTHWTPVHVHAGTGQTTGRIAILEGETITPGARVRCQLVLDNPLGLVAGDRFILRDQSARTTLGGGTTIDIAPPRRGRAKPERLAWLDAIDTRDHATALRAAIATKSDGVDLTAFAANRNMTPAEMDTVSAGLDVITLDYDGRKLAFSKAHWDALTEAVKARLATAGSATAGAVTESEILAATAYRLAKSTVIAIARRLAADGVIVSDTLGVRLARQTVALAPADQTVWQAVEAAFDAAGLRPLTLHDLADRTDIPPQRLKSFLSRASRHGLIVYISKSRITTPAALRELAGLAEAIASAAADGQITVPAFRDRSGIGRNAAIEVLEHFDKRRLTRRDGDGRVLIGPAAGFPVNGNPS